jgi:phosphopantothenoylcysteine decarboxylase/phosphopantothenate--cysteine ligase
VVTADEMHRAVRRALGQRCAPERRSQYLIMSAAVCDHRPEAVLGAKMKQPERQPYTLALVPNADIVAGIAAERAAIERESGARLTVVGFGAETARDAELVAHAKTKLSKKGLDLLVANSIEEAVERDTSEVWLVDRTGREEKFGVAAKEAVADKILDCALGI